MQTLTEIKALLAERGLRPKHALGQNYLHDHNQLRKLVAAAAVQRGDLVLEVGPGTGTLTETLLDVGARVVACELDRDMAAIVQDRNLARLCENPALLSAGQVHVIRGDCLDGKHALSAEVIAALDAAGAGGAADAGGAAATDGSADTAARSTYRLVANLPYQAATPLMATLLESHPACIGQFVTVQREVADRMAAGAGSDAYGPLSVTMSLLAEVKVIATVPPGCFWPAPTVTSAMIAVQPRAERAVQPWAPFAQFVQRVFGQRRKQLGSMLGRDAVAAAGFDPQRRPETLAPQEWVALYGCFRS
ncbi:MAG: 16S rRNA (adenine(1518)-N(6)/adenine(1519)-N(6))-dimethyltransferase [Phycisphaerae bacterium]|nr:16S rRNA (adenine(1518)-N(6)/adenine(1519)-N(6))-dimethyltransferase [Phycisphaerae bacterium]